MSPFELRTLAEEGCDPELYEQAAAELKAIGFICASEACRERARYYRSAEMFTKVHEVELELS